MILSAIYRYLRRNYYIFFRPDYIVKSLSKRKGSCLNCGCCRTMIIKCRHFKNPNTCLRFNNLPIECKIYPFDEKDKAEFSKLNCGYWWP